MGRFNLLGLAVLASLPSLVTANPGTSSRPFSEPFMLTSELAGRRTFDYVVIGRFGCHLACQVILRPRSLAGGGTAGLVVATRLSEDPDTTVAVIEAGPHHVDEPLVDTPGEYDPSYCRSPQNSR